ncbi:MAG: endonuclease/exonuclease/phosphatase family protein [Lentisphaerae bacterium]|nr:endonuclease/exonuclease/phosphatase family protein [Lentisphaerota bacterium]
MAGLCLSRRRPLRVLTLNLWGFAEPYPERQRLLRRELRTLDPDVMAFQEAGFDGHRHQVKELLEGRGFHVAHQFDVKTPERIDIGCCIASRWPMEVVELLSLQLTENSRFDLYAALAVRIAAPSPVGPLLFVNAKPSWELNREYERELQAVAVAGLIRRHTTREGFPPILAGDFDATPDSASIRFLSGKQSLSGLSVHFRDMWEEAGDGSNGYTWTRRNAFARKLIREILHAERHARRIDYLFLGSFHDFAPFASVRTCRVVMNKPRHRVWPSDHFGVFAEIDVEPAQGL